MRAVSQALVEFANHFREPASPGREVIDTARYRIVFQPDHPIAGPNNISWIRRGRDEADDVINEAHATTAPRGLPMMWILDPETEPPNFADFLESRGIHPDPHGPEVKTMVLPIDAPIDATSVDGLEFNDALADLDTFRKADAVNAEAFMIRDRGDDPGVTAAQERRRRNQLDAGNRHFLLATVDGEPAGSGGLTVYAPHGAIINGGAVRPKFRGRGVYRALVAARLEIARRARVPGLSVWGGRMSAPILERLGFETVGWRRLYVDQARDSSQAR